MAETTSAERMRKHHQNKANNDPEFKRRKTNVHLCQKKKKK